MALTIRTPQGRVAFIAACTEDQRKAMLHYLMAASPENFDLAADLVLREENL